MKDITGIDLKKFVREVYDLSRPQGLGFLHYKPGGLTDEEVEKAVGVPTRGIALNLDYVKGRACKMIVFEKDGRLLIRDSWYDHTDVQLAELLKRMGIPGSGPVEQKGHNES